MSREIQLTPSGVAIVDDSDFEELSKYKWYLTPCLNTQYALRHKSRTGDPEGKARKVSMHKDLLKTTGSTKIDHRDGNGLNNQRSNLRPCTHAQNMANRGIPSTNKSGYKGVSFRKGIQGRKDKWAAVIGVNSKTVHIGLFVTKEEAAIAYNKAAAKHHGEFAFLNEIPANHVV